MHSASKTRISDDTARQLVATHFGAAAALTSCAELTGGFFSAAYLLALADGGRYVVKIAPPPAVRVLRYERDIMRAEVEALRLVRQQSSVPVPRVLAYDTSKSLVSADYFVMDFVPGEPLHTLRNALPAETQETIDRTLGGYLRQMNTICGPAFGHLGKQSYGTWRGAFDGMLRDLLDDGREIGAVLPASPDALYDGLARHFCCLDDVEEPRFVHWDLWDGNVFVDPATGRIHGIIDFERALWGDPLMEFNFRDYRDNSPFGAGYGVPMLHTPAQRSRRSLYSAYLYLVMLIEDVFREYETHEVTDWARGLLAEELARLGIS